MDYSKLSMFLALPPTYVHMQVLLIKQSTYTCMYVGWYCEKYNTWVAWLTAIILLLYHYHITILVNTYVFLSPLVGDVEGAVELEATGTTGRRSEQQL